MRQSREVVHVLDGKIYVLGRYDSEGLVRDSEVYDPKENSWAPIILTLSPGYAYRHGGMDFLTWQTDFDEGSDENLGPRILQLYSPAKHEWRFITPSPGTDGESLWREENCMSSPEMVFMSTTLIPIYIWRGLHSCSFAAFGCLSAGTVAVVAVKDELFAAVADLSGDDPTFGNYVVRSEGLC